MHFLCKGAKGMCVAKIVPLCVSVCLWQMSCWGKW